METDVGFARKFGMPYVSLSSSESLMHVSLLSACFKWLSNCSQVAAADDWRSQRAAGGIARGAGGARARRARGSRRTARVSARVPLRVTRGPRRLAE